MVSFYAWKYPKSSSIWSTMPHQIVQTKSAYLGKYLKSGIATGIKHSFFELFFISRILSHGLWHLLTKLETRCGHWLSFLCLLLRKWILSLSKMKLLSSVFLFCSAIWFVSGQLDLEKGPFKLTWRPSRALSHASSIASETLELKEHQMVCRAKRGSFRTLSIGADGTSLDCVSVKEPHFLHRSLIVKKATE